MPDLNTLRRDVEGCERRNVITDWQTGVSLAELREIGHYSWNGVTTVGENFPVVS